MLNIELAEKVLQHVEAHPDLHNQNHWAKRTACGTTACLAGWTVFLGAPDLVIQWVDDDDSDDDEVVYWGNEVEVDPEGEECVDIEQYAAHLLGVEYRQLHDVFFTMDNEKAIDRFRSLVEEAKRDAAATD